VNDRVEAIAESMKDNFEEISDGVNVSFIEINENVDEKLSKLSERVDDRLSKLNDRLSKKIEDNARDVVNKELSHFKSTMLNETQSKLDECVNIANTNSDAKLNELPSRVAKMQGRRQTDSCFQANNTSAYWQVVGIASLPTESGTVGTVLSGGVNALNTKVMMLG
jgi:ElaB/YqjD/DUF883 family membrane-anchored ribosome-binding protein